MCLVDLLVVNAPLAQQHQQGTLGAVAHKHDLAIWLIDKEGLKAMHG
jgi:hypothetical protein